MHSCKLFGTTGLAGGFLYKKKPDFIKLLSGLAFNIHETT